MSDQKPWQIKISNGNKYHQQWATRFRCDSLEEYVEGFQWRSIIDLPYYRPYAVNLVKAELKKKLANILHQRIRYELTPTPTSFEYDPQVAMVSAQKKEDVLNTLIGNPRINFKQNVKLSAKDSFSRFGVLEVGYAADWQNPNYKAPLLSSHDDPNIPIEDAKVVEVFEVPSNERVYVKRIKPSRFRVSVSDSPFINNCAWVGYYSYFYKAALLKNKDIKLPKDVKQKLLSTEYVDSKSYERKDGASADSKDMQAALQRGEVLKVWTIWDNESGEKLLIDDASSEEIWSAKFDRINLVTHVHDERYDGFYPVPPIYDWICPQDEVNQAREQMRNYRRRFTRKFESHGVDQEEMEKFKTELDGEIIKLKNPNAFIRAIGNPEIGISITEGLTAGRDDFNIVSGSSSDLNTVQADRTTATQSKISAAKAEIIESSEKIAFDDFYIGIGREFLSVVKERFTEPIQAKSRTGNDIPFMGAMNPGIAPVYQLIYPGQLNDNYDVEIEFSVIDSSPLRMDEELQKMIKFLSLTTQFPQIMMSPILIQEAAYRCGFRNSRVIAEMQRVALLQMMGQAAQMGGEGAVKQLMAGQNANNTAESNMVQNAIPPAQDQIDAQL